MVEGTGMKCIKYLMFFFNLVFLLAGLAMIVIGAYGEWYSSAKLGVINSGAIFIIVLGCIIFVVSFLGCCGAIKENRVLLITFGVLMIIILILSIAAIITAFVYMGKTSDFLRQLMDDQIRQYNAMDVKDVASTFWNTTQLQGHCCGTDGPLDWKKNYQLNATESVPDSCCMENVTTRDGCGQHYFSEGPAPKSAIYTTGCFLTLKEAFNRSMLVIAAIAIIVAILQVMGIALAFSLAHAIRKGYNVV